MLIKNLSMGFGNCRDERGFTLIETLVAMLSAVVVVGALYAILDISLDQAARVTDVVQATQVGNVTMTKIVSELRSACIAPEFTPIQAESNANELRFINSYTKEAEITKAVEHRIKWESSTGVITDYSYPSESGSWPTFTFASTASPSSGVRVGEDIAQGEEIIKKETKTVPIFQYYTYAKTSRVGSEESFDTLSQEALKVEASKKGLTATQAAEAAAVEINIKQSPIDKYTGELRTADLKNEVTLSFSAPNAETPIKDKPCE
jgi:Tfp pilus assembly protein PilW